jgi:hypothetical protein
MISCKEKIKYFWRVNLKKIVVKDSFKKKDVPYKKFLKDLNLLIVKNNLPIQFVETI